jgi:hypothetical protein
MAAGLEYVVLVHGKRITPDDLIVHDPVLRAIWVGGGEAQGNKPGMLTMTLAGQDQTPVQLFGVPPGTMLNLAVVCVHPSTTCTQLVGFY